MGTRPMDQQRTTSKHANTAILYACVGKDLDTPTRYLRGMAKILANYKHVLCKNVFIILI